MDYNKDIKIDETSLDVEWLQQASLTFKYSKHAANMLKEHVKQKEKVGFIKSELDKKIRTNPEKYGIDKITENAIFNTILSIQEYKDENTKLIEAEFEYNVAQGAVKALQDKKSALENLVKLYGQNYFSGPSVPRNISKEWEAAENSKKSDDLVAGSMKRTRGQN